MRASTVARMEIDPLLVSVLQASHMVGRGVATIYELIGAGEIVAVKSGGRTLIRVDSLRRYVDKLPPAKVAPPRHRQPQHLRNGELRPHKAERLRQPEPETETANT